MKIIYADTLVLLNIAVDYVLLLSAGKLCAAPLRRVRMVCFDSRTMRAYEDALRQLEA